MAFDLLVNNLGSDHAIIDQPGGLIPSGDNWIGNYLWDEQHHLPDVTAMLHMRNGKGKLFKFIELLMSKRRSYASDEVKHAELGRIRNKLKAVTVVNSNPATSATFTVPVTATQPQSNVRVGDILLIFDGVGIGTQATVTSIISPTQFVAFNNSNTNFAFVGPVNIIVDFSNSFAKGTAGFTQGREYKPEVYTNYSHIIKEFYRVNNSDMAHKSWVQTPYGPMWYNLEMEATDCIFDDKVEFTHLTHRRHAVGDAQGMNGLIPTVEQRGNIANEYIETLDDLRAIVWRMIQQGIKVKEFTVWCDFFQKTRFTDMIAGLNANFAGGANYGTFGNEATAIKLGFNSVQVEGITFHFQQMDALNDPTALGDELALLSSTGAIIVPSGRKNVTVDGQSTSLPYLSVMYRAAGATNRNKIVTIKGDNFAHKQDDNVDITTVDFKTEQTQQLIGANAYVIVNRSSFYE